MEALTAVVFASGVAVAFLFLPMERAEAALVGDTPGSAPGRRPSPWSSRSSLSS